MALIQSMRYAVVASTKVDDLVESLRAVPAGADLIEVSFEEAPFSATGKLLTLRYEVHVSG